MVAAMQLLLSLQPLKLCTNKFSKTKKREYIVRVRPGKNKKREDEKEEMRKGKTMAS